MATIYKRKDPRAIPAGAKIENYRGQPYAVWTDGRTGRTVRAPLNAAGTKIVQEAEFYTIEFFDEHGKRRKRSSRCADKDAAQEIANAVEAKCSLRKRGLIDPAAERFAADAKRPIAEHMSGFRSSLHDKGTTAPHAEQTADRAERVLEGCGVRFIPDISAASVEAYLAKLRAQGRSIQTSNHYLKAAKQFTRWLYRERCAASDPLQHLSALNAKTDRRHDRRALSVDEMQRLVAAVEAGDLIEGLNGADRAMMYILSAWTGFRRGEIASLSRTSFELDAETPIVTVNACYSKRRRTDSVPLHAAVVERLRGWMDTKCDHNPGALLFQLRSAGGHWRKTAKMMREDLSAARAQWIQEAPSEDDRKRRKASDFLTYQDDDGLFADFHANRHTFVSNLGRAGVPLTTAQKLARHHDPKLTANVYTHLEVADHAGAIASLPAPPAASAPLVEPVVLAATGTDDQSPVEAREHLRGQLGGNSLQIVASDGEEKTPPPKENARRNVLPLNTIGERRRELTSVHPARLERATFGSVDRCSIQLSYGCESGGYGNGKFLGRKGRATVTFFIGGASGYWVG